MPVLLKLFQKNEEKEMHPKSFCMASITLTPKLDRHHKKINEERKRKKERKEGRKRKLQASICDEHRCKILNKILTN